MLIGLHGRMGSGKDTAYSFIRNWAESERRPVRRDAFADRLKLSAAGALGYRGDSQGAIAFCDDLKEKRAVGYMTPNRPDFEVDHPMSFITGRQYLQYYGEAHRQVFGDDFWIRPVLNGYQDSEEMLVITDVRLANEAEAIHALGGQVWRVTREPDNNNDLDISEQRLPDLHVDYAIANNRGLDHFRDLILTQLERVYL